MALIAPLTAGPIESALNSLVNLSAGGPAGSADEPRAAMIFTSRLRQNILRDASSRAESILRAGEEEANNFLTGNNELGLRGDSTLFAATREARRRRRIKLNDITNQMVRAMPEIALAVNPTSVEFRQPKRFSKDDTQRGTVFHFFSNAKGQNLDILTMSFQGTTGNISRRQTNQEARDRALARLKIWHNLMQLTREPMLLEDGHPNVFTISYVSALFPVQIDFKGFFPDVITFKEEGTKPNSRDYSFDFIVTETSPDLNELLPIILDFTTQVSVASPSEDATSLINVNNPLTFLG